MKKKLQMSGSSALDVNCGGLLVPVAAAPRHRADPNLAEKERNLYSFRESNPCPNAGMYQKSMIVFIYF
jgi:hypothetical protein